MSSRSNDDASGLKSLGSSIAANHALLEGPRADILEAFPNRGGSDYLIKILHPEFTSNCPKTGQPDFARILVEYIPRDLCVESKSFKLYMNAYRNHHSFMETIVNRIKDDLAQTLQPKYLRVTGEFLPRGGTYITPVAVYFDPACFSLEELGHLLRIFGGS
jgi:7-cyano-7-deazaguanine reductase